MKGLSLDVARLIEVFLLGKSNRLIRLATAHLLKSVYDSGAMIASALLPFFTQKFGSLSAAGVNSSEFLGIFGYFCYKELSKEAPALSDSQIADIVKFVSSQIQTCN